MKKKLISLISLALVFSSAKLLEVSIARAVADFVGPVPEDVDKPTRLANPDSWPEICDPLNSGCSAGIIKSEGLYVGVTVNA